MRERYRERLFAFRLDTLPRIKHRFQAGIYRYLVARQRRRRPVQIQTSASRRIATRGGRTMASGGGGYVSDSGGGTPGERGNRRKKLAAMAGSVYRAGASAVAEMRETYAQQRGPDMLGNGSHATTIPGAFPGVAITVSGDDQMVLFPSYAKHHVKRDWGAEAQHHAAAPHGSLQDEDYWKLEWERNEDETAIVDVDVRGWVYSPHKGPMTRRNRILLGLARQMSGIPVPRAPGSANDAQEQERIRREAAEIERRGQHEKKKAYRGEYSEMPRDEENDIDDFYGTSASATPAGSGSVPGSPAMAPTRAGSGVYDLSEAELAVANANLMARVSPFLTTPMVELPVSVFFYNEESSCSKTVVTNEAGHFVLRAALNFIPTHVRVLANANLSAIQDVRITDSHGVSLISDIDDTIKRSNISAGAREIFRNTFVRDLADLTVDGVREWYNTMHAHGVSIHYCSNSPWQLFPVLASYFSIAGLPPGSLHLKQYSGMLQGIFEPVAERKKSTLNRLLKDFPGRRFLLVGDSGEADLEVYTDLAVANPGRILAVFIRDVTSPEQTTGYFDQSFEAPLTSASTSRVQSAGPVMGTLIDFSDEPEEAKLDRSEALAQIRSSTSTNPTKRRPPPPPKPKSLRSTPSQAAENTTPATGTILSSPKAHDDTAPGNPSRPSIPHPSKSLSPNLLTTNQHNNNKRHLAAHLNPNNNRNTRDSDVDYSPLPPPTFPHSPAADAIAAVGAAAAGHPPQPPQFPLPTSGASTPSAGHGSPTLGAANKKLELWRRRLARAHEVLDDQGVKLYTWRRGEDVVEEAIGIIKSCADK